METKVVVMKERESTWQKRRALKKFKGRRSAKTNNSSGKGKEKNERKGKEECCSYV